MTKVLLILITSFFLNISLAQSENCLEFNGNTNYVLIGDENNFGTDDFTIEAWVYFNYTFNSNGYKIINKGNTSVGTPSNAGYSLRGFCTSLGADLDFSVGHSDGTICRITHNGLSAKKWYHIAGVRNGRQLSLYVDGLLVKQEVFGLVCNVNTNMPLSIGAIHKGGLSRVNEFMDGKIDEVRFWSTARSQTQIFNSKDCAINTPTVNLLTVYNFDQSNSFLANDASGNNINGILTNYPTWTTSTVALECNIDIIEPNIINYIYIDQTTSIISLTIDASQISYIVYDVTGKIIQNIDNYSGNKITLKGLLKGIYIIEIRNQNNIIIGKEKFIQY